MAKSASFKSYSKFRFGIFTREIWQLKNNGFPDLFKVTLHSYLTSSSTSFRPSRIEQLLLGITGPQFLDKRPFRITWNLLFPSADFWSFQTCKRDLNLGLGIHILSSCSAPFYCNLQTSSQSKFECVWFPFSSSVFWDLPVAFGSLFWFEYGLWVSI